MFISTNYDDIHAACPYFKFIYLMRMALGNFGISVIQNVESLKFTNSLDFIVNYFLPLWYFDDTFLLFIKHILSSG